MPRRTKGGHRPQSQSNVKRVWGITPGVVRGVLQGLPTKGVSMVAVERVSLVDHAPAASLKEHNHES